MLYAFCTFQMTFQFSTGVVLRHTLTHSDTACRVVCLLLSTWHVPRVARPARVRAGRATGSTRRHAPHPSPTPLNTLTKDNVIWRDPPRGGPPTYTDTTGTASHLAASRPHDLGRMSTAFHTYIPQNHLVESRSLRLSLCAEPVLCGSAGCTRGRALEYTVPFWPNRTAHPADAQRDGCACRAANRHPLTCCCCCSRSV